MDPLLPSTIPLPTCGTGDVRFDVPGGTGLARVLRADPATLEHTWNPAERYTLTAHIGERDPVTAMDMLLSRWARMVLATAEDVESAAVVTWPSRDLEMVPTFLAHGLAPRSVLAIRLAGQGGGSGAAGVAVRSTTEADVDTIVAMELELVRLNQLLGQMTERVNTAELIRAKHTGEGRPWSWLAEVDGTPVGLLAVLDPNRAPWASGLSSAGAAVYLSDLLVLPDRRGAGVGAAMVRHVHRELDGLGFNAVVLHYLGMNPFSGPFWHRCGYRPLTTGWEVRPASQLMSARR